MTSISHGSCLVTSYIFLIGYSGTVTTKCLIGWYFWPGTTWSVDSLCWCSVRNRDSMKFIHWNHTSACKTRWKITEGHTRKARLLVNKHKRGIQQECFIYVGIYRRPTLIYFDIFSDSEIKFVERKMVHRHKKQTESDTYNTLTFWLHI